jgi:hypothetical protein
MPKIGNDIDPRTGIPHQNMKIGAKITLFEEK